MKITKEQLRQIVLDEVKIFEGGYNPNKPWDAFFPPSKPLERTHQGKVVTPQSVAGKLLNLAAEVEALGEDFFADSDSLAAWANDFMAKHNIMKDS